MLVSVLRRVLSSFRRWATDELRDARHFAVAKITKFISFSENEKGVLRSVLLRSLTVLHLAGGYPRWIDFRQWKNHAFLVLACANSLVLYCFINKLGSWSSRGYDFAGEILL